MAKLVVLGTMGSDPYAGMAWMHMQITVGLQRLGHDVYYFETTSAWPYDPVRQTSVADCDFVVPYIRRVADEFGLGDRWAFRKSFSDKSWVNMSQQRAEALLQEADAVFNVSGATRLREEGLEIGRLIYLGTDPVTQEIAYANQDQGVVSLINEHDEFVTYGENIGTPECSVPPLPNLKARTRQPVLIDLWQPVDQRRAHFTTVGNWKQVGKDVEYQGNTYHWSKHLEFLKVIDLPRWVDAPMEFATGLQNMEPSDRELLESHGWNLVDAHAFSNDPWRYKDYIVHSHGEFTVAKDQNVRLKSGWFSERTACYLTAGLPVVTQDTGFATCLPTGRGLFAFNTLEEAHAAIDAVESDYSRHCTAAREIACEYFDSSKVLSKLLEELSIC